jgi:hypothetical protein
MSSDNSVVELIDIENDFANFAWKTTNFFSMSNPINSYQYSLFEIGDTNNYIAVFIESEGTVTIKKFSIKAFASDNQKEIQTATISDGYNGRVVTAFRLDAIQLIVILYSRSTSLYFYYYNDNLEYQGQKHFYDVYNLNNIEGNFFKLIYMKDIYFALAFFQDRNSGSSLHFHLKKYVNMVDYDTLIHYYDFTDFQFRTDVQANGLYKLTDERVALFSTSEYNSNYFGLLHMFLIDFYNNFAEMKMREFRFYYSDKRFVKEMSAYDYNGYIFFSATLDNTDNSGNNIFSILMIFGFANGTDLTIDISPYLADSGNYNEEKNLYNDLMDTMTIDNNIFGYVKVEQIRLVSICDELLLYRGKSDSRETNTVPIGESFGSQYTLLQDKSRIKNEDTLYTLCQYISGKLTIMDLETILYKHITIFTQGLTYAVSKVCDNQEIIYYLDDLRNNVYTDNNIKNLVNTMLIKMVRSTKENHNKIIVTKEQFKEMLKKYDISSVQSIRSLLMTNY